MSDKIQVKLYHNAYTKFIREIVMPKFPEIQNFQIDRVDYFEFGVWIFFHITFEVRDMSEEKEIEIEKLMETMRDYFGERRIKIIITFKNSFPLENF